MNIQSLHTSQALNAGQLDKIINDIKADLGMRGFIKAIYHQMNRYGYGQNHNIFKQIGDEMRRRSAVKPRHGGIPSYTLSGSNWAVELAARDASRKYEDALASTPNVDDVDEFDFVSNAAVKYGVSVNDVLKATRALRT